MPQIDLPLLCHEFAYNDLAFQFIFGHLLGTLRSHARRGQVVPAAILSWARAEYFHESKPLVLQGCFEGFDERSYVVDRVAHHVGCPCCGHQLAEIEGLLGVALRSGRGVRAFRSRGCQLPSRHAVDEIVGADDGEVQVPAGGVDEMVASDRRDVVAKAMGRPCVTWRVSAAK